MGWRSREPGNRRAWSAAITSEGVLGLCIGDVVGKGIPAALLMSNLQATVRAFASGTLAPAELCTRLHRLIRNNVAMGRFVTFFYARFDTRMRELRYCNAGHNPPLLVSGDGTHRELGTGGPALGAFAQATYREDAVVLRQGDRLVLYTDGVTEAASPGAEQFGDRRLAELIASNRESGAFALQEEIVKAVKEFSGDDLQDDVTLLVLAVS